VRAARRQKRQGYEETREITEQTEITERTEIFRFFRSFRYFRLFRDLSSHLVPDIRPRLHDVDPIADCQPLDILITPTEYTFNTQGCA
jgi:hypothetical protein